LSIGGKIGLLVFLGWNTDLTDITTCLENYTEESYNENCYWKKGGIWNDRKIRAG
jgi:hypothetical protein